MSISLTLRTAKINRGPFRPIPSMIRSVVHPRRRILVHPHSLRYAMVLGRIFACNGYRAVTDPLAPHEFSIHVPSTVARHVVNGRHRNNLKTRVAATWQAVSGRPLAVDPTTHDGPLVEKSDANATHDGRVLHGPIAPRDVVPGKVYQRLVDNTVDDDVMDLRVPFHGGTIPFVYLKRRPVTARFANANTRVDIAETDGVFDADEQALLLRFAEASGLDFGEADVLRDNTDGRIWVVDSTNGPAGPPADLCDRGRRDATARLAAAFDAMLVRMAAGVPCLTPPTRPAEA